MSERERQRRTEQSRRDEAASFTVDEWCRHRRISKAMFYKLAEQGLAPKSYHVGTRRMITAEADAAWVREREAVTDTAPNAA